MNRKTKIIAGAFLALGLTAGTFSLVNASTTNGVNPVSSLVNAIATKFNLKPADVQQVFNDQRAQMKVRMDQTFAQRLAQAVTNGTLTQAQADLITAKKVEVDAFVASLKGKTPAEIQAAMKTKMDSLKQWATANNIPNEYLMFGGFGGRGMGGMRGHGMGRPNDNDADDATTSPSPSATLN